VYKRLGDSKHILPLRFYFSQEINPQIDLLSIARAKQFRALGCIAFCPRVVFNHYMEFHFTTLIDLNKLPLDKHGDVSADVKLN